MPTEESIRSVLEKLKTPYDLRSVSIFGSFAEGRATERSDLDRFAENCWRKPP